ncbi:hypothetical protein Vretimale_14732 [Volvox reticuliferus]|uniref:Uncharacterized protein n=1 Tax=Volvox reticuliferus TaxID=1737510 RepID=A0A8J4FRT3_9CHLO|nr:hypothetical protein Vretifemale_15578 [Volvox reticuliferus]GIM11188.1 hypothetical protein Vretimale_14732 [Volvox reticuliferus]
MSLKFIVTLLALGLSTKTLASHKGCGHPHGAKRLELYGKINFNFSIRTSKPDAVRPLFNLGFVLAAGYNQPEARRAFRDALREDNLCAMCWWGVAYARGPFQNKFALPPPQSELFDPLIDSSTYYTNVDYEVALNATKIAADLVGLVSWREADSTIMKIQADPKSGLMSRLPRCKHAGGRHRMLSTHLTGGDHATTSDSSGSNSPAPPSNQNSSTSDGETMAPGPSSSSSSSMDSKSPSIDRERYYIAAMFDRLSASEWYGEKWGAAEALYAENMIEVASCFPNDANALALAAEAYANLSPWDFAEPLGGSTGIPPDGTKQIIRLLQKSLKRDPLNPLALHLMIHVTEELPARNSSNSTDYAAGLGLESAQRLLNMFPTLDHMQHMPSHTFVRVGLWQEAVQSNLYALRASVNASKNCLSTLYADHNVAMLVFAASMAAQYDTAQVYSRVLRELPRFVSDSPFSVVGSQWIAPLLVYVRFGNWTKIALEKPPPGIAGPSLVNSQELQSRVQAALGVVASQSNDDSDVVDDVALDAQVKPSKRPDPMAEKDYYRRQPRDGPDLALATWLYSQFMAVANTKRTNETEQLLNDLKDRLKAVVAGMQDDKEAWGRSPGQGLGVLVPGYKLMGELMLKMVDARLKWIDGKKEDALEVLKSAVELEDQAGYTEPPRIAQQPVRQCLGHVYLKAQEYSKAVQAYSDDLDRYPDNPWSIKGVLTITNELLKLSKKGEGVDLQDVNDRASTLTWYASDNAKKIAAQIQSSCFAFG